MGWTAVSTKVGSPVVLATTAEVGLKPTSTLKGITTPVGVINPANSALSTTRTQEVIGSGTFPTSGAHSQVVALDPTWRSLWVLGQALGTATGTGTTTGLLYESYPSLGGPSTLKRIPVFYGADDQVTVAMTGLKNTKWWIGADLDPTDMTVVALGPSVQSSLAPAVAVANNLLPAAAGVIPLDVLSLGGATKLAFTATTTSTQILAAPPTGHAWRLHGANNSTPSVIAVLQGSSGGANIINLAGGTFTYIGGMIITTAIYSQTGSGTASGLLAYDEVHLPTFQ